MKSGSTVPDRLLRYARLAVFAAGVLAFVLLAAQQSDVPAVFGRYSVGRAVLLALVAANLIVFWLFGPGSEHARRAEAFRPIRSYGDAVGLFVALAGIAVLVDFTLPGVLPPRTPRDAVLWSALALLALQLARARPGTIVPAKAALLLASLVVAVLLVEVAFRTVILRAEVPRTEAEFLTLVEPLWPHPVAVDKPEGTYRILGLADSFGTMGGAEWNFHALLEGLLAGPGARRMEVVNISVEAYEPGHHLKILPFGLRYEPDLVLHSFFVGNDFSLDDEAMYSYQDIPIRPRQWSPYRPGQFLSRLWLANAAQAWGEQARRTAAAPGVAPEGTFSPETFLEIQRNRLDVWGRPDNTPHMERVLAVLDRVRALATSRGAGYALIVHPDQTQVDVGLRASLWRAAGFDPDRYDIDLPQRVLGEYCRAYAVACLDLLPVMRQGAAHEDLYLLRNTHYNQVGNRVAAEAIASFLEEVHPGAFPEPHRRGRRTAGRTSRPAIPSVTSGMYRRFVPGPFPRNGPDNQIERR